MKHYGGRQHGHAASGGEQRDSGEGNRGEPSGRHHASYAPSTRARGDGFRGRRKKYADGGVTDPLAGMSPTELAKLRAELAAKPRDLTVNEQWENYGSTGKAIAGMLPVIGNAMSAYDAYQGGRGAVEAAQAGDVRGTALNSAAAGIGALGALSPLPWSRRAGRMVEDAGSTARIFAGPSAKTANKAALARAEEMRAKGADRDEIYRKTGWFWGADGQPRFEIDDTGARLEGNRLVHPGYEAAYGKPPAVYSQPDLDTVGRYQPGTDSHNPYITIRSGADAGGTHLHELQHHVQALEGTARGGGKGEADYRQLAGEVEARNVQTRRNWDAKRRREMAPWRTQDVPDERQIVRHTAGAQDAFPLYHGTPHDVDRFRMDKIGSGEGAQVYGHGLYFAEEPGVAKVYRDVLAAPKIGDEVITDSQARDLLRMKEDGRLPLHIEDTRKRIQRRLDGPVEEGWRSRARSMALDKYMADLEIAERFRDNEVGRSGNVYRVDIDAEPEDFLDLDLPLSQQSPRVQEAIRKLGFEPAEYHDGHWLQSELNRRASNSDEWMNANEDISARLVSEQLREAGIPGNRFLDQFSRAGFDGNLPEGVKPTRNFVVWNEGLIGAPVLTDYANGGRTSRWAAYANGGRVTVGAVEGDTGGREDALQVRVPEGAYVIPADVVAALGEGNTPAGMRRLEQQFGKVRAARAGAVVPIQISDGEFVVPPEAVEMVGGPDILDQFVLQARAQFVQHLQGLEGPNQ